MKQINKSLTGIGIIAIICILIPMTGSSRPIDGPDDSNILYCYGRVYDHMGNKLQFAHVYLINSAGTVVAIDTTDAYGYYSLSYTHTTATNFKLRAFKTYYETQEPTISYSGNKNINFYLEGIYAEKIAAFFYASDAVLDSYINGFENYLGYEGFDDTYEFKDTTDWKAALSFIDGLEGTDDFVFIYISGHGAYANGNSVVRVNPGTTSLATKGVGSVYIYSNELRTEIDKLESKNIMIVVESCFSGGFYEDFRYRAGTQIITSTDNTNPAFFLNGQEMSLASPDVGYFSYHFFAKIHSGYSDVEAYSIARTMTINFATIWTSNQVPMRADNTVYNWFKFW